MKRTMKKTTSKWSQICDIKEFSLILDPIWEHHNVKEEELKRLFHAGGYEEDWRGVQVYTPANFVFSHNEKKIKHLEEEMNKHGVDTSDFLIIQGWCLGGSRDWDDEIGYSFSKPVEVFWMSSVDCTIQDAVENFTGKGWIEEIEEESEKSEDSEKDQKTLTLNSFWDYRNHLPEIATLSGLSLEELEDDIEEVLEDLIGNGTVLIMEG